MEFEAGSGGLALLMIAAFVVDWPRALAGLAFGAISRYLLMAHRRSTGGGRHWRRQENSFTRKSGAQRNRRSVPSRSGFFRSPRQLPISI